ncbi:MAG: glycosyl hydrolase [Marinilabiliales bacterium]|nr:MAG: glycosyl hydrolase [Marinilabiliales bacterium]
MKKIFLILFPLIAFLFLSVFYYESNDAEVEQFKEYPNNWFQAQRAYPFKSINHKQYLKAIDQAKLMLSEKSGNNASWEFAGPENLEGRITDIELLPGNSQTIFIASAAGGIFKTTNSGITWIPVFDSESSLSIGDIAISQSNPEVIYVGTGEANAGGGSLAYDGTGIFKSIDGGTNWISIGLENSGSIGRMQVHPDNPEVLYVAAMGRLFSDGSQGGIYKTTDGGMSWEQKLFISDSTGAIDVVINPDNPEVVYAAMWERVRRPGRRSYGGPTSGIYKSVDGGENWTELTNGLPLLSSEKGRIGIDISESNTDVLYAVYADSIGYFQGMYKTLNAGDSWLNISNGIDSDAYASYGWWFGRVEVDPTDHNTAYLIGFYPYKTSNGGSSWNNIATWIVHVDQHAVAIDPMANNKVFLGNDGGFYTSQNGGLSWQWNEKLPITQFYTCEVDEQFPERIYGGTQDNGTNRTMTGDFDDWESIYGGDGFRVLVDPIDNNYVYAEYQYGGLGRSTNGGNSFSGATNGISGYNRFNWNSPLAFDPQNPATLYFGSQKLYKSVNHAQSWTAISGDLTEGLGDGNIAFNTLTTVSVSPFNSDLIYTGSDDGSVYFTPDGGDSWTKISDDLPDRWITSVATDPYLINKVYVTLSGYRWDEYQPHVLMSDDYGYSWIDISSNLPEAPVNEIIIDPEKEGFLYVATDLGVFYSENNGDSWMPAGDGMPLIVVTDLRLHNPSRTLIAATFGRGMYKMDLSILTSLGNKNTLNDDQINCYPNPFSTLINIELKDEFANKSRVEIINSKGQMVKTINSTKNNKLLWDGTNENGEIQEAGIYFIRITSNNKTIIRKIIKSK